jgi:hypothetical protein
MASRGNPQRCLLHLHLIFVTQKTGFLDQENAMLCKDDWQR